MSRSYRKSPFSSNACANSDKPGKVQANRKLRAGVRVVFAACNDLEGLLMPLLREVSCVYDFPKDGKHYMHDPAADWYIKGMRK